MNSPELNNCPFCGNAVRWCGENNLIPSDDHLCHQIACDTCEANFDINVFQLKCENSWDEALQEISDRFNKRSS